ncbi:MAG: hypothetical protein V4812_20665 [Pseudomonadota bacterium]
MRAIDDLLSSDMQTLETRDVYLHYAKNVLSGNNARFELTGNAFNVCFSISGVCIESLWDEEAELLNIDLNKFIEVVSNWHPKKA